jgi:hypothetical protein
MNFSDITHDPADFTFHGAMELAPEQACTDDVITALAAWGHRSKHASPGLDLLQLERRPHFLFSHDGHAQDYWSNQSANDISKTLVREFL